MHLIEWLVHSYWITLKWVIRLIWYSLPYSLCVLPLRLVPIHCWHYSILMWSHIHSTIGHSGSVTMTSIVKSIRYLNYVLHYEWHQNQWSHSYNYLNITSCHWHSTSSNSRPHSSSFPTYSLKMAILNYYDVWLQHSVCRISVALMIQSNCSCYGMSESVIYRINITLLRSIRLRIIKWLGVSQ